MTSCEGPKKFDRTVKVHIVLSGLPFPGIINNDLLGDIEVC